MSTPICAVIQYYLPEPIMPLPSATGIFTSIAVIVAILIARRGNTQHCGNTSGDKYNVCEKKLIEFHKDGLTILENVISEDKLRVIEEVYDRYMREGSPEIQGRDFW